jgi:hypothetical protein
LDSDEKTRKNIEKDIQNKIKEMRMGKKVLEDEALVNIEAELDGESLEEDVEDIQE